MEDLSAQRLQSMQLAVQLHCHKFRGDEALVGTATSIFDWLIGPIAIFVTLGQVLVQGTGQPAGYSVKGSQMQLRETDQIDLSVSVQSVKGSPIPDRPGDITDDLIWLISDESVAQLAVSEDTRTCTVVAGVPGTADISVSLGDLSARLACDVVPGDASVLTISEGTPVSQPTV